MDFDNFELKYFNEEDKSLFVQIKNQSDFPNIDLEYLNAFFKVIVNNDLLLHLPEEILIDNIFTNSFFEINVTDAEKII